MSLVILSNTSLYEGETNVIDGIDKAYSFTNTLQSPIVIPANSEVALQSLKINKDGTFQVARSNSTMYQYIGTKLTDALTYDLSTRHPAQIRLDPYGEYNADDFVRDVLKPNMNTGLYHPDYQGLANASVQRNSSVSFEGYNLTYDKAASASSTNVRPTGDSTPTNQAYLVNGTVASTGWTYNASQHKFNKESPENGSRCFAQFSHAPLSLSQSHFKVAFNAATLWNIGLSRYCNPQANFIDPEGNVEEKNFTQPSYFSGDDTGFYDFVARKVYNASSAVYELKLYHSVWDATFNDFSLDEVKYYGYTGATYATPYDLSTNASAFTNLEFYIDGDQVEVYLEKDSGVDRTLVCSPDLGTPGKVNYFKPVNQSCAYLYGKMEIIGDQNEHLILHQYGGRTLTGFKYNGVDSSKSHELPIGSRLINFDWWNTLLWLGTTSYAEEVDKRKFNIMTDGHIHTFQKTSGGKVPYDVVLILSESKKYQPTRFANTEELLGFIGSSPVETPSSFNGSAVTFKSYVTPILVSNQSVFLRLNGLTQRSINGATGNQSNIIYHCPRFDNSGNQTGGLFFEPGEKTYLDINNPSDIHINNLSIDFVDKRERFVKSIVGSSVVCLHIRAKK